MKALIQNSPNSALVLQEREVPVPGPGQIRIRVEACGVCHSDLALQEGDFPFAHFPVVPGHEVAGVVDAVGEGVSWPQVGDRVGMPWLYSACLHCKQCAHGDEVMCAEGQVTGVTVDGGYQEYLIAPALFAAPIPEALDFADAAPLMCAGITVFNGLRNAGFQPGDKVAVIGLGGLGHLGVMFARAMGAEVAVVSSSASKEELAYQLGAAKFINSKSTDLTQALWAWGGADIVLATAPAVEPMQAAIGGLAPDGTLVIVGAAGGELKIAPMDLILGRRHIMGSPSGSRKDIRDTLEFAAAHGIRPQITRFPLAEAQKALDEMKAGKLIGRAVLTLG